MNNLTMDSTVGEIIGEPKGTPPSDRLLELIKGVIQKMAPDRKWYVDFSIFNDRVDITMSDPYEMRGTSLPLNEDIGYGIHHVVLALTHHHEWHKGLSIGGVTIKPYEWYPQLVDQQKFLKDHPEWVDKIYVKEGVLEEVNEIRKIIKEEQ